jgi:hypothetical protein
VDTDVPAFVLLWEAATATCGNATVTDHALLTHSTVRWNETERENLPRVEPHPSPRQPYNGACAAVEESNAPSRLSPTARTQVASRLPDKF